MKNVYIDRIKPYMSKVGMHKYISELYHTLHPASYIDIHGRESLRQRADKVYEFGSSEEVNVSVNLETSSETHSTVQKTNKGVNGTYTFNQPFVAVINNGIILKRLGACVTPDFVPILETIQSRESRLQSFLQAHLGYSTRLLYGQKVSKTSRTTSYDYDTAVSFIRPMRGNEKPAAGYSHWLQSYLTRLQGLEYYINKTGNRPKVIVEKHAPSWITESLEFFGYGNDIVEWDPAETIRVKDLIVPSVRRLEEQQGKNRESSKYKIISPVACKWLRKTAVSRCDIGSGEFSDRVFISRDDADRRQLKNREGVVEYLRQDGFESYELTQLSFAEQVALFSQADKIIGVHGAGLANLIFVGEGCTVTEIIGDSYKPTYQITASFLDLDYKLASGESIKSSHADVHHQDIEICPEEVI